MKLIRSAVVRTAILLYLLVVLPAAQACMWIHGTTVRGTLEKREGRWQPSYLKTEMNRDVREAKHLFSAYTYPDNNPVAQANDRAVQGLLLGEAQEAVRRLQEIESKHPGVYYTAANLGTAYELAGDDAKALEWIRTGIQRNRDSHMRTEWLHVRILETKLNLKTQPDWLLKNTITQVDTSRLLEDGYKISTAQGDLSMEAVKASLYEQLSVRMLLVKPKDPIVAQLLVELARMEHALGFQESVVELLDMAVRYGHSEAFVADLRANAQELIRQTWFARWMLKAPQFLIDGLLAAVILLLGGALFLSFKARRGRALQSPPPSVHAD